MSYVCVACVVLSNKYFTIQEQIDKCVKICCWMTLTKTFFLAKRCNELESTSGEDLLFLLSGVVGCVEGSGLQECEIVHYFPPELLGSWVAVSEAVWWPLHSRLLSLQSARPRLRQRLLRVMQNSSIFDCFWEEGRSWGLTSCSHSSTYQVLIPRLVFLDDFEQVKSIGRCLEEDWRQLLAKCFPKIMVNILPYFALPGQDPQAAKQREKAHRVYNLLKDSSCLGKQVKAANTTNLTWVSF